MKCLLIETKDKRKFFTHKKNFSQLIEFCKIFKANLSIVNMKEGAILDLEELVPALCNPKQKKQNYEYVVIENKISPCCEKPNKREMAKKIQNNIKNNFLSNKIIVLKELKGKYNKYGFSDANLCNYVKKIKNELSKEGYTFSKIAAGAYKIL
jgi:hypothetical protein